ncbi:hypothetical protein [Maricaulis sp. MIT060901]|uniref:hypothetical protein n=1 Tax=Maricaulis sp. MIT060901 TaxID=3096993 RepID=UPI00399AABDE
MRTLIIYTAVAGALFLVPGNQDGHALTATETRTDYQVACVDTLPELAETAAPEGETEILYCS